MSENKDIRWKQRYQHYHKLIHHLRRGLKNRSPESSDLMYQAGLTTHFNLSFEMLWKLLKDYLEYLEVEIDIRSPKNILKIAANSGLLEKIDVDGNVLMNAHKSRNELSHIYDFDKAEEILEKIENNYLDEMLKVDTYFQELM